MDNPHDYQPEEDSAVGPPAPTQAQLEAMLDADEAEMAAGRAVPLEPVLSDVRWQRSWPSADFDIVAAASDVFKTSLQ